MNFILIFQIIRAVFLQQRRKFLEFPYLQKKQWPGCPGHCKKSILVSLLRFCTTYTATLWCRSLCRLLLLYTSKLRVNHNTSTVLANNDFLSHADIHLTLWRYLAEATCTSITLNIHDTQAIAGALAYALERSQQTWLDVKLEVMGLLAEFLFLGLCLGNDILKLSLLHIKVLTTLFKQVGCALEFLAFLLLLFLRVVNLLLIMLDYMVPSRMVWAPQSSIFFRASCMSLVASFSCLRVSSWATACAPGSVSFQ